MKPKQITNSCPGIFKIFENTFSEDLPTVTFSNTNIGTYNQKFGQISILG